MLKISGRHTAFLLAVASIVLLSSNATVAILSSEGTSFLWFSTISSAVTVLALTPSAGRYWKHLFRYLAFEKWFWAAIILKAVNDLAFYYAVIESRSIEATIIVYLYPIINVLVGALLLEKSYQRLNAKEWALVLAAFASVVLLTPISGMTELPVVYFIAAAVSASASVYVVLIQVVADRNELRSEQETHLLSAIFLGSLLVHVGVLLAIDVLPFESFKRLSEFPTITYPLLMGAIWIGVAVNILSEAMWLRAARLYRAISLKSLFYLSPVLGACYLAAFGIDDLNAVVVFCLTGVVASNFLIHQQQIDDVSYSAFLLGLIVATVTLSLEETHTSLKVFALSSEAFQTQITFVSIIAGFIIFKAFELYQKSWDATTEFIMTASKAAAEQKVGVTALEALFDRLMLEPDIEIWSEQSTSQKQNEALALMRDQKVSDAYYKYFCARLARLSRPERFLIYIVCLTAIPSILAQAIQAESGTFVAAFSAGLFLFLPVFVDDQASFRSGRPLHGITLRRAVALRRQVTPADAKMPPVFASRRYLRNQNSSSWITVLITLVSFVSSWWLLEGSI